MTEDEGSRGDSGWGLVQDRAGAGVVRQLSVTECKMMALVESFPTLRGALTEWDPEALDTWAMGPAATSGGLYAAQFVLSVWNDGAEWRCGHFGVSRAMSAWDGAHRAAFLEWAIKPWWP